MNVGMTKETTHNHGSSEDQTHAEGGQNVDESLRPYSNFSQRQKAVIVALIATAGFFSPFTAFIYFPALQSIASDLGVTIELMNITVTVYLLVQALVPAFLGDLSESIGRRPVYLLIFVVYCAASIGLALQRDYTALLVLRMLQSAGSSGTIALAYGVIGDIAAPHERGAYVGVSHIGFNSAPALGPVTGGVLADRAGWPWIFVFLAAISGLLLLLLALFLYETARSIVGNGSIPASWLNVPLLELMRRGNTQESTTRVRPRVPNILPCLRLIFHKHTFPVLLANATFYMIYSCLQATLAALLQEHYHLTPFQAGLCYLSFGVAAGGASVSLLLLRSAFQER
jgi:multidrug resistance protein